MKWQIRGVSPGHKSSWDTGRLSDVIREAPCRGVRVVSGGACGQGSERLCTTGRGRQVQQATRSQRTQISSRRFGVWSTVRHQEKTQKQKRTSRFTHCWQMKHQTGVTITIKRQYSTVNTGIVSISFNSNLKINFFTKSHYYFLFCPSLWACLCVGQNKNCIGPTKLYTVLWIKLQWHYFLATIGYSWIS